VSQANDDYAGITIRSTPVPVPDRVGSWWRRRWTFVVAGGRREFRLPPPLGDATDLQLVASCWWESESQLVLELHTRNEQLSGDELTYVSIVAAWLAVCFPDAEIIVDGVRDHPLLKTSRLSPDLVRYLRDHGY
jgi:hypothetical protein